MGRRGHPPHLFATNRRMTAVIRPFRPQNEAVPRKHAEGFTAHMRTKPDVHVHGERDAGVPTVGGVVVDDRIAAI